MLYCCSLMCFAVVGSTLLKALDLWWPPWWRYLSPLFLFSEITIIPSWHLPPWPWNQSRSITSHLDLLQIGKPPSHEAMTIIIIIIKILSSPSIHGGGHYCHFTMACMGILGTSCACGYNYHPIHMPNHSFPNCISYSPNTSVISNRNLIFQHLKLSQIIVFY